MTNQTESIETKENADLAGQNERLVMSNGDWKAKAAKLYGDDVKQWRFKCQIYNIEVVHEECETVPVMEFDA